MMLDPSAMPPLPPQMQPPVGNPTPPTRAQWIIMAAIVLLMVGETYYFLHVR